MDRLLARILVCPLCHGPFDWTELARHGSEILEARLQCPACGTRASVHDSIGLFLPGDAPEPPGGAAGVGKVAPAPGPTPESGATSPTARSPAGWPATVGRPADWIADRCGAPSGRLLELGPGVGELTGRLARQPGLRPIVADPEAETFQQLKARTDPGLAWDGLVFEPHSMPLADRSLGTVVSQFGLQNLRGTGIVLRELRRVSERALLVAAFLTDHDGPNHRWIAGQGLEEAFVESACLSAFEKAHWKVRFEPKVDSLLAVPPGGPEDGEPFPRSPEVMRWGLLVAE